MPGVRSSTILLLTALVVSIQAVSSQPDRDLDQNPDLDQEVRRHRLLQRAHGAGLLSQVGVILICQRRWTAVGSLGGRWT